MEQAYNFSGFEAVYAEMTFAEQVPVAMSLLQDSAAEGDLFTLSWILDQSTVADYYADDELLLLFEICSAAAVAIQNGHVKVVDELIARYPGCRNDLLLECVVEMHRKTFNEMHRKTDKKEIGNSFRWLNRQVSTETMFEIWSLSREYQQEDAMRWFSFQRLF